MTLLCTHHYPRCGYVVLRVRVSIQAACLIFEAEKFEGVREGLFELEHIITHDYETANSVLFMFVSSSSSLVCFPVYAVVVSHMTSTLICIRI